MFSLLISPTSNLPVVINQNSQNYWDLKQAGYTEQATGCKSEMLEREEEILSENYGQLVND